MGAGDGDGRGKGWDCVLRVGCVKEMLEWRDGA